MSTENMESLLRKLNNLDGNILKSSKTGMQKGIKIITKNAKMKAPVNTGDLREHITDNVVVKNEEIIGESGTNKEQGIYAEFGTGPKGMKGAKNLPSEIASKITYKADGWWIHESQIDEETALRYHFYKIKTKDGIFYKCDGQEAQPFLHPAYKEEKDNVIETICNQIKKDIKKLGG